MLMSSGEKAEGIEEIKTEIGLRELNLFCNFRMSLILRSYIFITVDSVRLKCLVSSWEMLAVGQCYHKM